MTSLSEALADFSLNLFRAAAKPGENGFLSPVSISMALGMTYAGADGETAKQMNKALFAGVKEEEIHKGMATIATLLAQPKTGYQLHSANRIYGQDGYKLLPEFVAILMKHYQSELQSVDFKTNGEQVRQAINKWVEEVTKERIKNLLPSGVLTADTRLVLVNAIYFKGDWVHKFKGHDTLERVFYSAPNKETKVEMMAQTDDFLYTETDEVQVLGMPYKAPNLAMFAFLPKERYGLAEFEKKLTGKKLIDLITKTTTREVIVQFPKFRLEQSFSLNDALSQIGMSDMFDDKQADLSKITGKKDLYVSQVVHKAFIEVNEQGSEAAGATAAIMCDMSLAMPTGPPPLRFTADHPFLFAILDKDTLSLLFAGHFANV